VSQERPPALDPDAVREFVVAGHGDLDAVRTALDGESGLLNACWDWGGGDFETALGGASHMGRRDIGEFLLERGARLDVFAAAMLDMEDVVRAVLAADPAARDSLGPHGIPLVAHARAGGADRVVALLEG
jgi:hypothetical protein